MHYVSLDQQLNKWTYYARLYPDIFVKRTTKLNICWFSCFLGNLKCSHSTLTFQILLKRFSHHKSGHDHRHPHHSLIFPYINIHHLKCNVSSLFRKLKCIKKLECCKVLWHPSQSLLFPLVKFYFIITFITFVDRLQIIMLVAPEVLVWVQAMTVTTEPILERFFKTRGKSYPYILTMCTLYLAKSRSEAVFRSQ